MNPGTPPPRAEQGLEWLVVVIIVGSGILLAFIAQGWLQIALGSLVVAIILNFGLLSIAVARSGNWHRFGVAIFGSVPAGIFDAVKIFMVGIGVYGILVLLR